MPDQFYKAPTDAETAAARAKIEDMIRTDDMFALVLSAVETEMGAELGEPGNLFDLRGFALEGSSIEEALEERRSDAQLAFDRTVRKLSNRDETMQGLFWVSRGFAYELAYSWRSRRLLGEPSEFMLWSETFDSISLPEILGLAVEQVAKATFGYATPTPGEIYWGAVKSARAFREAVEREYGARIMPVDLTSEF